MASGLRRIRLSETKRTHKGVLLQKDDERELDDRLLDSTLLKDLDLEALQASVQLRDVAHAGPSVRTDDECQVVEVLEGAQVGQQELVRLDDLARREVGEGGEAVAHDGGRDVVVCRSSKLEVLDVEQRRGWRVGEAVVGERLEASLARQRVSGAPSRLSPCPNEGVDVDEALPGHPHLLRCAVLKLIGSSAEEGEGGPADELVGAVGEVVERRGSWTA